MCHKLTSKKRRCCRLSSAVDRFLDNDPRHIQISHSFVVDLDEFVRVLYNRSWRGSSSYLQSQRMMTEIILEIFEDSVRGVVTTLVLFHLRYLWKNVTLSWSRSSNFISPGALFDWSVRFLDFPRTPDTRSWRRTDPRTEWTWWEGWRDLSKIRWLSAKLNIRSHSESLPHNARTEDQRAKGGVIEKIVSQ